MYTTLGAPSGALGASNGAQSGTESRISTLTTPAKSDITRPLEITTNAPRAPTLTPSLEATHPAEHHPSGVTQRLSAAPYVTATISAESRRPCPTRIRPIVACGRRRRSEERRVGQECG